MKPNRWNRLLSALTGPPLSSAFVVTMIGLAAQPVQSATLTWDVLPGVAGTGDGIITGGAGTWDTTVANWTSDVGATNVAWVNGVTPDVAEFGGTAGSVTQDGIVTNGLIFNTAGYTVTGGTLTLDGTTPKITANADATISSILAGTAGMTKDGTAILSISTAATYTGGTIVDAGVLNLTGGGGASGTIRGTATVNTGGTLRLSTGDATGYDTGAASLTTINLNGGALNINTASNQTLGGAVVNMTGGSITGIAGSNLDFFNNTSALNVLGSANTSNISGTRINLRQNNGVLFDVADGASAADLLVSSVISNSAGFTNNNLKKTGAGTMQISAANTLNTAIEVQQGRLLVSGFNGLLNASGITVSPGATLELGATNIFVNGHGTAIGNSRVFTINSGTLLMNGSFDARFGNVTLNDGATWTSNRVLTNYDALLANTTTGAATVSVTGTGVSTMNGTGGIHLQGVQNFVVADTTASTASDLVVSMVLAGPGTTGGANGGINKSGPGTMTLSGANTYTGATLVTGGTLLVTNAQRTSSTFDVGTGATLELAATNIFVTTHGAALPDTKVITVDGGTLLMSSAFDSRFGSVTLNNGATWTSNRALTAWDALLANTTAGAANVTVGGSGASTMNGSGGLHLQGFQNFAVNNATGDAAADLVVTMRLDNAGLAGGTGGVTKSGDGTMLLNGFNTYTAGTVVNAGIFAVDGDQQFNRLTNNHAVTVNGGAFEIRGVNALPSAGLSIDATVNPGGSLNVVSGGSTAIGTGGQSHAHVRNLNLNGGAVNLSYSGAGSAYNGESFQLNGTVVVGGSSASTIQSSTSIGNSGVALAGTRTFTVNDVTGSGASDLIVSAELENNDASTGALTKDGPGTLSFTGGVAHSYTGTTTVAAGTVSGNGSVAGPLLVQAGGTIAPGIAAGSFGAGATTIAGTYACEIDGPNADTLVVSGNLDLAGSTLALSVLGGGATEASYTIATYTGTLTGTFGTPTGLPSGYAVNYDTPGQIRLVGSGDAYGSWETANGIAGAGANTDSDNDGIPNGIEFVIGGDPSGPGSDSSVLLPTLTTDANYLYFTYRRTDDSASYDPFVEFGSNLTGWTEAQAGVPLVSPVVINDVNNGFGPGIDSVEVRIPRSLAADARLFARLRVTIP